MSATAVTAPAVTVTPTAPQVPARLDCGCLIANADLFGHCCGKPLDRQAFALADEDIPHPPHVHSFRSTHP